MKKIMVVTSFIGITIIAFVPNAEMVSHHRLLTLGVYLMGIGTGISLFGWLHPKIGD